MPQDTHQNSPQARPRLSGQGFLARPSNLGLVLGGLAFIAALTPSLVPRGDVLQGLIAGIGFALGYGVGVGLVALARVFELLPAGMPRHRWPTLATLIIAGACILFGVVNSGRWQNGVRAVMDLPPVENHSALIVAIVAVAVAVVFVALGRLFRIAWIFFANLMLVVLPVRAALLAGLIAASALFWSFGSGVLGGALLDGLDTAYANLDTLIPPEKDPPQSPLKSGSPASLVPWTSLGAQGRAHMLAAPDRQEIEAFTGRPAREPIRVYAGVNSARDPAERARLALEELERTGGFDRANLVIATPTGTGWIDPAAATPMEYLLEGDVATVSVQYSYLPSWLSLFVEPERGVETAQEVFRAVYGHWANLPEDSRPRLFLFGLSLGALNSDLSINVFDILGAPFDGALWVGAPFPSRTWNAVTDARDAGTPVWLPRTGEGRVVRFTNQENALEDGHAAWGPMRIVYLQYPSDPIVFFEPERIIRPPRIVETPRAPDIAPGLTWVPVVSWVQMMVDMMIAASTPRGFGHVYAAGHYLDGWIALTDPVGWSGADLERLSRMLDAQGL
jgi:uncharacterized membrane protein